MQKVKVTREKMKDWTREQRIDYYCNTNDEITIATQNTKLGTQVCGLSMPKGLTCRPDAPCAKGCYAGKGNQVYASVFGTHCKNLRLYHKFGDEFFDKVSAYLKFSGYRYMRFFDSGDCPDYNFFSGLVKTCNDNPNVHFLMYTKKYDIPNKFIEEGGEIPKNFKVFFSAWTKNWTIDNPYNFQIAYVDFKDKTINPSLPKDAYCCQDGTGNCSTCYKCFHTDKDVIFRQH